MNLQKTKRNSRRYLPFGWLAVVLLPLTLLTGTSADNRDFQMGEGGKSPEIKVTAKKDPRVYDTVEPNVGGLHFNLFVNGRCPEKHSLGSAAITVAQTKQPYPVNHDHRSLGAHNGLDSIKVPFTTPYYKPDLAAYYHFIAKDHNPKSLSDPAEACNAELERLVKKGSDRTDLLQKGFQFHTFRAYKGLFEVVCKNNKIGYSPDHRYSHSSDINVDIHCLPTGYKAPQRTPGQPQRTPGPPLRTPSPDPPIQSVSVVADPPETEGRKCPVYVNFRGRITAGEQSQYGTFNTKYRFVGEKNYKTDWLNVSVVRGQPRTVNGRRFIQEPQNDSSGTLKAPGGTVKIPVYRGFMALEVMLPNGTIKSERADFSVDCNVQGRIRARL